MSKRVEWDCWIVVKNHYTHSLESSEKYIAVTDENTDVLDVITSLHDRLMTKQNPTSDYYLLDFKVRGKSVGDDE